MTKFINIETISDDQINQVLNTLGDAARQNEMVAVDGDTQNEWVNESGFRNIIRFWLDDIYTHEPSVTISLDPQPAPIELPFEVQRLIAAGKLALAQEAKRIEQNRLIAHQEMCEAWQPFFDCIAQIVEIEPLLEYLTIDQNYDRPFSTVHGMIVVPGLNPIHVRFRATNDDVWLLENHMTVSDKFDERPLEDHPSLIVAMARAAELYAPIPF